MFYAAASRPACCSSGRRASLRVLATGYIVGNSIGGLASDLRGWGDGAGRYTEKEWREVLDGRDRVRRFYNRPR